MRRMRDFGIGHYVAVAVPVLAAVFGIHHWVRHTNFGGAGKGFATAQTPASTTASRKLASGSHKKGEDDDVIGGVEDAADDRAVRKEDRSVVATTHRRSATDLQPSRAFEGAANDAAAAGATCAPIEYRGDGPQFTQVTKGEWTTVMDQFHSAKHELLGWLEKHRGEIAEASALAMEHQVRNLKIQRPPSSEEPDLAWRGIGLYSQTGEGEPIIKLGGGFVRLAVLNPVRARFEMARLVAQTWAPCELQRVSSADATWSPLLKCLGLPENQACGQGTYSESGWAVSTTMAAAVQPPGCGIPAFKAADTGKCLSNLTLSRATARTISSVTSATSEGGHR